MAVEGELEVLRWCTVNTGEQDKCLEMAEAVSREIAKFGKALFSVQCVNVSPTLFRIDRGEDGTTFFILHCFFPLRRSTKPSACGCWTWAGPT